MNAIPEVKLEHWARENFADHRLEVLKEDGLYRHWRCQQPGRWVYGFDVVTWPGYLCVCGDIGTWTFSRLRDMLPFFENSGRVNLDYWAEKLVDGPERARNRRWDHDEEERCERFIEDGWNAQFVYACHGIVLAIKLYRELKSVESRPATAEEARIEREARS